MFFIKMITICPFVAEESNNQYDSYAVVNNTDVEFFKYSDKGIDKLGPFVLKGFRSIELKELWNKEVSPLINYRSFDWQI